MLYILLNHDYLKGMEIGIRICEIYIKNASANFGDMAEVVHMLLYPTCYDPVDLESKVLIEIGHSKESKVESMNKWFASWSKESFEYLMNKQISKMNADEKKQRELMDIVGEPKIALPMLVLEM